MKRFLLILMILVLTIPIFAGKKLQDYNALATGTAVDADLIRIEDMSAAAGTRTHKWLLSSMKDYIEEGLTMTGTMDCGAQTLSGSALLFTGGSFDGGTVGTNSVPITDFKCDDIQINGKTISTFADNDDITIDPHGTGDINLTTAGGLVKFTEGDIYIGATTLTATAPEMNYLDGTESDVYGMDECLHRNEITLTGDTTVSGAGFYPCDTSSAAIAVTMPALSNTNAGMEVLIALKIAGNDLTIVDNAADSGFSLVTGDDTQVTGTSITFSTAGDNVLLRNCGLTGRWIIVGGYGVDLAP